MRSIVWWEDYAFLFRDALHREIKWTPFSAGMIKGVSSDLCDWCKQSQSLWTILVCVRLGAYLCLTLCDLMNYRSPGSSVHGISQARILEWVAISSSRESFQPRDQTLISWVSCIAGGFFTIELTGSTTWRTYWLLHSLLSKFCGLFISTLKIFKQQKPIFYICTLFVNYIMW